MTKFNKLAGQIKQKASEPSEVVSGDMYFNTTEEVFWFHNGTQFKGAQITTTSTSSSTTTSSSTSTTTT